MRWTVAFLLMGAIPADDASLLKTFRTEFVEVTPGKGRFPSHFAFGCSDTQTSNRQAAPQSAFAIAKYEVPQNLWEAVMGNNPSRWKGRRNSVEMVSIDEARAFCRKVTQAMRQAKLIEQDQVVRLPSEREWEYACRAGTTTQFSFGDDDAQLDAYAWSTHNAAGNDPPVGAKKPNPWGLYDMHGYLWEWCELPAEDKVRDDKANQGVLRGGSWKDRAALLRSCSRRVADGKLQDDAVGFRCILARERVSSSPLAN